MPFALYERPDPRRRITVGAALGLAIACTILMAMPAVARAQGVPALPRVALEDDGTGSALRLIGEAGPLAVSIAARVVSSRVVIDTPLEARLERLEAAGVAVWLSIPVPSSEDEIDSWRNGLGRLLDRPRSTLRILELSVDLQPAALARFAVQVAATEVSARRGDVRVAIGGSGLQDEPRRQDIYSQEVAPYVDLLSLPDDRVGGAVEWLDSIDRGAQIILWTSGDLPPVPEPPHFLIETVVQDLGTAVITRAWRSFEVTPEALGALASLDGLLEHTVSGLEPEAVGLSLHAASGTIPPSLRYRLLFDADTFSTLLVYWGAAAGDPLTVELRVPIEGAPGVVDLLTGARSPAAGYAREQATERTRARVPLTGNPMLVNFNEGATAPAAGTTVVAERHLTVGEIIARHQQQQLAQERLVRTYMADARMRQFFRPTITDPGYDIVTENRYFVAGDGIEWEELSFAVNNRRFENRPPLPMLQPEKVFSLPLQLRFDDGYRYRLHGLERVDGIDCYKVGFEPVRDDPSLYRGTVWIDRRTFARIRVHAVQGGLPGMVVSNDETLRYVPVATIDGRPVLLLGTLNGRQIVLLAGRNIVLEKTVTFSEFRVNDDAFEELRASARQSERIMYRETPGGLRHYIKRDGERVISERLTDGVKAMAIGLVVDPSYAFPLPIFGINYMDFSFGSPDAQLALLFGGVLVAGNIQRPQVGSRRLNASVDFFAIAAPSSDRIYRSDGEVESERVLTWPMSTGLNLGWQATPFQKLTLQYQFRFDAYVRDRTTAETFRPPSSTMTNGIGGAWEYSRGGYTLASGATWFTRTRAKPWGDEQSGLEAAVRHYTKYTATISRDFLLDAFQKVNVNAAWFGGRGLDRFVKYQFGMFDATRIHGVPSAVRFEELAVARGSYSVNIFDQYRLDLFLDHAWGRDGDEDRTWQTIPGIGAAFNLRAPWNTMLRADLGRSWLPARYGSLGLTTLQIMLLKPMR